MLLWYALHVHSNTESLVTEKLCNGYIRAFYPHVFAKSKDKRREIELKFMPGYVFAEFDLAEKTPVVAINQVVSILGWGTHAAPVPAAEIESVRLIVKFPDAAPCPYVPNGHKVRIKWGPFAGIVGVVVRTPANQFKLVVSIEMMGRSVATEIDAGSVESAEPAPAPTPDLSNASNVSKAA